MSMFRKRHPQTNAPRRRPTALHLETLEGRALPTYFSVSQVPALLTLDQATVGVQVRQDQGPVADVAVAASSHPVGMGYQSGYFSSDGSLDNALRIDTAPGPGQQLGQHVKIALSYTWTDTLQTNEGTEMPPWDTFITSSASVVTRKVNDTLFEDNLSTSFTLAAQDGSTDRLVIPIKVGESIYIGVSLNGEAHCAEPHYQTWIDFQAEFVVQDARRGALVAGQGDVSDPELAAGFSPADAVFSEHGGDVFRPASLPSLAGYVAVTQPAGASARWLAGSSAQDTATLPGTSRTGVSKDDSPPVKERLVQNRPGSPVAGISELGRLTDVSDDRSIT